MNEIRNILIGFQLDQEKSQICYYDRKSQEPVSLVTRVGSSLCEFPTALCKVEGKDEWHFGLEAEYFGQQPGGILLNHLYEQWQNNETVQVDKVEMEPWQLMAIYFRESLKMLGVKDIIKGLGGLMVTCPKLNKDFVDHMKKAFESLGFSRDILHIQDYDESFYYYTMYQKPEIWMRKTALYSFDGDGVGFQTLEINRKTKPALVTLSAVREWKLRTTPQEWDEDFYHVILDTIGTDTYSSVFMIGEGFNREWACKSLPLLGKNRKHIFYGNNLYVKGACYGAKEKTEEKNLKDYLFMSHDLVGTNVGMEMLVRGMRVYYPLVVAGTNWYEASTECEFILDDKTSLEFVTSKMEGGEKSNCKMLLDGLPNRPNRTTRLQLKAECISTESCCITVSDLGFGDMYPSSGKTWTENMEI